MNFGLYWTLMDLILLNNSHKFTLHYDNNLNELHRYQGAVWEHVDLIKYHIRFISHDFLCKGNDTIYLIWGQNTQNKTSQPTNQPINQPTKKKIQASKQTNKQRSKQASKQPPPPPFNPLNTTLPVLLVHSLWQ